MMHRYKKSYFYLSLCCAPLAHADAPYYDIPPAVSYSDGLFFDWQPTPSRTVCDGEYILPVFDPAFPEDETLVNANEVSLSQTGVSILTGDVIVNEKNRRLYSQKIYLHRDTQGEITTIESPGVTLLEQPELRLVSDNVHMVYGGQTTLTDVHYRYYPRQAQGSAQRVEYIEDMPVLLYHADYTTCSPDNEVWQVTGSKVRLNRETGRGESFNSLLKIYDVPILYSPYLNFPIDDRRKSGFLMPEFGSQTDSGYIVGTPYYFNLAPNYDATFYPRYMSERGLQYGGEVRYLDSYHQTQLYGTFLGHDRAFATFQEQEQNNPSYSDPNDPRLTGVTQVDDDRWNIELNHTGNYDENWDTEVVYNKVSDDNYFADLGTDIFNRDERQLLQLAQINYVDEVYSASAFVQDYQILQPFDNDLYVNPYQILPHLELDITPDVTFWDTATAMNAQFTYFDHIEDPVLYDQRPTIGARTHLNPLAQKPIRRSYGYLLPSAEFRYTQYSLTPSIIDEMLDSPTQISRALPTVYLDGGLYFDRDTEFLSKKYHQTLEPRLFYLYTPFEDQSDIPLFDTSLYDFNTDQLFRTNRFNGLDRIADANQISAAITTRFYEKETGIERFRATMGQILYFEDREVTLCNVDFEPYCSASDNLGNDSVTSPFVGDLGYQFNENWLSTMAVRLDPTPAETDLYRLLFHYQAPSQSLVHFGFHYDQSGNIITGAEPGSDEAKLLQTDTGVIIPLDQHLTLQSRWYYDIQNQFTVEIYGGIEYESCCWAVRAGARRYLEGSNAEISRQYDSQLFLQFIFKGLAGVGTNPSSLLVSSIPGYNDKFSKNSNF
jgi:LPS-assembly protein